MLTLKLLGHAQTGFDIMKVKLLLISLRDSQSTLVQLKYDAMSVSITEAALGKRLPVLRTAYKHVA